VRSALIALILSVAAGIAAYVQAAPAVQVAPEAQPAPAARAVPSAPAVPAARQASRVAVIPLRGAIDDVTAESVDRRVQLAIDEGAQAIVLELDTPGGDLMSTLRICDAVKSRLPANTVAWVHPHAYSAGAIIALSAREIVMSPSAAMGDAAPIQAVPGLGMMPLPAAERAKVESPVVAEVVDSARRRGYDERLVASFVRLGQPLWLAERTDGSARAIIDAQEHSALFGSSAPADAAPIPVPEEADPPLLPFIQRLTQATPAAPEAPAVLERPDLEPQRGREALGAGDRGQWRLVGQIVGPEQLLVVYPDEARALKLASGVVADDRDLAGWFGATTVTRYEESWSETLVRFLTSWPVRIALIAVLLISFFIEASSPGLGIFGAISLVALLLLTGAPALLGLAQWWPALAVACGLLLILAEVVLFPGMAIPAIAGGILVLVGLLASFVTRDLSTPAGQSQLASAVATVLGGCFAAGVGIWIAGRILPRTRGAARLVLAAEAGVASGPPDREPAARDALRVGDVGRAITDLRPAGRADFGRGPVDAQSIGEWLSAGTLVRVVALRPGSCEVDRCEDVPAGAPAQPRDDAPGGSSS
jgi:membrane-bound serine protease (ClpP class)